MSENTNIKMYSFTIDCIDHHALAGFYAKLLGWVIAFGHDDYVVVAPPGTQQGAYPCITFQRNPDYQPPVWPEAPNAQQQMAHLDFAVDNLEASVQHALDCGATLSPSQFSDDWKVMFDPAGHPFCLCLMGSLIQSADFALR